MKAETNDHQDDNSDQARFTGVSSEHVLPRLASSIDLFRISKKTKLDAIPKDAVLQIQLPDQTAVDLYRAPDGNFDLLTEDEKGNVGRLPIKILGSSVTPTAFYEPDYITQGGYFQYGIRRQFRSGQDEGIPGQYQYFDDPAKLDPSTLEDNLAMGLVVPAEDGGYLWSVVDQQPPLGPVSSAVVTHNEGMDQAL